MSGDFKPSRRNSDGRWVLSNDRGIIGGKTPDGQTGILTWATEDEAQQGADRLNRPSTSRSWVAWLWG